jgi:hypothetical protein
MVGKFEKSEVLLDNQVDVSVIHPSLLREIEQAESSVNINGVGVSCTYRGKCLSYIYLTMMSNLNIEGRCT